MTSAAPIQRMRRNAACLPGLAFAAAVLLAACGGGGGSSGAAGSGGTDLPSGYPGTPVSCTLGNQQAWLKDYMADQYLWYDRLGTPNAAAADMARYLDSLLYKPVDRYSYTQATTQFTQLTAEGTTTGYGYSLVWADAAQTVLKVRSVEPQSPVGQAGLLRGEQVISIDGYTPAQIVAGALPVASTVGVPRQFVVRNAAGVQRSFTARSANYMLTQVMKVSTLAAGTARVAYLDYREFLSAGNAALAQAVDSFRTAGVTDFILDLRYNGGGSVVVARNLASLVGGAALNGQAFVQLRFNARHPESSFSYAFTANPVTLGTSPLPALNRLVVITSGSTASASELVINGLRAFRSVVLVGSTTFGKPYGFLPRDACGTTYSAVNFDSVNALGVGGYSSGLAVNCAVADDLDHAPGDPAEARTAAALQYIQTGACPAGTAVAAAGSLLNPAQVGADGSSSAIKTGAIRSGSDETPLGEPVRRGMFFD